MSLKEIAEDVVRGVAPAKLIIGGILAVLVIGFLGWAGWRLFFADRAAAAKHDQVQAHGEAAISNAGANAGKDAIPVITNNYYQQRASDAKSQENRNAILSAPGAAVPLDPALAALVRRDICLRASASGLPECRALLGTGP